MPQNPVRITKYNSFYATSPGFRTGFPIYRTNTSVPLRVNTPPEGQDSSTKYAYTPAGAGWP